MSFSSDVKEELRTKIDSARHCQIAEFAAMMAFGGQVCFKNEKNKDLKSAYILFATENETVAETFKELAMRAFGVPESGVRRLGEEKKGGAVWLVIEDEQSVRHILMALKWESGNEQDIIKRVFAHPLIIQKECCKRAFIRGAFLAAGSISDPNKFYHYEIVCDESDDAAQLQSMLIFFNLDAKVIARKKNFVVYIKEGSHITDCLNVMGAFVSQMNLYNVMILKGMRNDVNRKVNCETANLNKTIEAAVKQIRDIEYIRDTVGLDYLKPSLREVAALRLENTDMNLKDIGAMLSPPVGKSGVNHRLRKISEIAQALRG